MNGSYVVTGGSDDSCYVYDVADGSLTTELQNSTGDIFGVGLQTQSTSAQLDVTADVTNSGTDQDTQTVTLDINNGVGQVDSTSVTLAGGGSTTQTLSWAVPSGQTEQDYTATVASDDDSASQTVTVRSIPSSVQHRYLFEQNGNDSVGSLDGTVNGGSGVFTATNPIEGQYSFVGDGSDNYLSLPNNLNIDSTQNGIAFEFTVEFSSVASGDGVFAFTTQNTGWYAFFSSTGTFDFAYLAEGNNPSVTASVSTGTLYNIVCQYNPSAGQTEVYVDGTLEDANGSGGSLNSTGRNEIGRQKGSRYLNATRLDDFRIHDSTVL